MQVGLKILLRPSVRHDRTINSVYGVLDHNHPNSKSS